ncbi:MAG: GntR family transcriptional regulator [Thermovirgaceae bacterium]|nr:GntR family transcriptional regulator [Thermovirgaceae bacterium]
MLNDPLSPARNIDLRQIVYEKIKEAIVEGLIRPGERLSEVDLADKLAVSRTPVREAIRQLAQTSLVTLEPRRGAFVSLPTVKDASDLYDLRTHLEIIAVRLVTVSKPIEELERWRPVFSSMTDQTETRHYLTEDRKFHAMLYEMSGNRYLTMMLHNIADLINLCRQYSVEGIPLSTFAHEHVAIIDAIETGDPDQAETVLHAHLDRSRGGLLNYLREHPELTASRDN